VIFGLMQAGSAQAARRYSTHTNLQGSDFARAFGTVELRMTHLVYARKGTGPATVYVNGVAVATEKPPFGPSSWEPKQTLSLGCAGGGNNPWRGEFHQLAFYDRALGPDDVARNFRAGLE